MSSMLLGVDHDDHIRITVEFRREEADDWLKSTIDVRAGSFRGSVPVTLLTIDFPAFRKQLEPLYDSLSGVAKFETIERQLRFTCTGNGHGGILI